MKTFIDIIIILLGFFVALPMNWYLSYLLFKHVQAPDTIWLLWIINIPMTLILSVLGEARKKVK